MRQVVRVSQLVFALASFLIAGAAIAQLEILGELQGPTRAERVIDGDTIVIEGDERLRIIGVDAPEVGEAYAETATNLTTELVGGRDLYVEFDVQERDSFGRLLAYVYVEDSAGAWEASDGRRFRQLSHELALAGLATAMTVPPNVTYAEVFVETAATARDRGLGVWEVWSCIDLNRSSRERLMDIVHIDDVRVDELIELRPWRRLDDLVRIRGIAAQRLGDIIRQGKICPLE